MRKHTSESLHKIFKEFRITQNIIRHKNTEIFYNVVGYSYFIKMLIKLKFK
jgi:hypothetical protein